jgi:hypothetical protein
MNGTRHIVFKRCGCTDEKTGRQLAGRCPHLAEPGHGSWYYAVQVSTVGGRKARYRRGGFASREAAVAARRAILDGPKGARRRLPAWARAGRRTRSHAA